jgi:hypothetical protein
MKISVNQPQDAPDKWASLSNYHILLKFNHSYILVTVQLTHHASHPSGLSCLIIVKGPSLS